LTIKVSGAPTTLSLGKRYRRISRFFLRVTWHVIWWDIILRRRGLQRFRTPYLPRWQQLARDYRDLAVEMGGVLIKLGQFLSVRVDVLPEEVTSELAGLQDEVPVEALDHITSRIEADFQQPINRLFAWFSPEALGSASLAQTHRAGLRSGETVVVKVLRPGIEEIVEVDLAAIAVFVRRLKYYPLIRNTVDLDKLIEEFDRVTRRELDLLLEGQSSERFAALFAEDQAIATPAVYWSYCASHVLTMEDVSYFSLNDKATLRAAGIAPEDVAQILARSFIEQILIYDFVHADPHAGNLFVRPLPTEEERMAGIAGFDPGEAVPEVESRPFQLVFIDFGMAVEINERMRGSLREYMIGIVTRDAQRIVESYAAGDMLRPDADVERLEEMIAELLNRFGDSLFGQVRQMDLFEYNRFVIDEYRDMLSNPPLQFQTELLFVLRAVALIAGLTLQLDEDFDIWSPVEPVVQKFIREEGRIDLQKVAQGTVEYGRVLAQLPQRADKVLKQAERGRLGVRVALQSETRKELRDVRRAVRGLTWTVASVGVLLAGVILYIGNQLSATISTRQE
jgi:predicted unusual protein kinase regulating ubiquinone biosynthesis (AarF/ABC1/UbiB family)